MARRICPICLAPLDPGDVLWRDAAGHAAAGPPARPGLVTRVRAKVRNEPDLTAKAWADWYARGFHAYCPVHHGELPEDMFSRELIVIGLVGEPGSSKTHYLAALLHQLSGGALASYDLIVNFDPGTVLRFQADYFRRLFIDHEVIPGNRRLNWIDEATGQKEIRLPMTVVLRNWRTGRAVNVCIFDASGEQLLSVRDQATWARHLSIADGLLFFVDSSVLPGVQRRTGDLSGGQTLHVTESVIDVTANLVRHAKSLSADDDISGVPAAVLLAKADLLPDDFPEQALEALDHLNDAPYRLANRLRQDSDLVEQYMADNGGRNLIISVAHKFPGVTFHAMSATGCAPESGVYPKLEPQRTLEPFLLLLARIGIIDMGRADG